MNPFLICEFCGRSLTETIHWCKVAGRNVVTPLPFVATVETPLDMAATPAGVHYSQTHGIDVPWPLIVRGISRRRISSDKGVGDTVHRILSKMGGTQFEWVMKRLGIDCGCGSRQEWLNAVYPYEIPVRQQNPL